MSATARVRTDPRISRRRQAIARSRRRSVLTWVALIAALVAGAWIAFWSPLLAVDGIVVVGAEHVSESDVAAVTGLDPSDNLLLVSTSGVASQVEELPWVARARVDRKLPGTVRVKVVERVARVVLVSADVRWLLDARGHVLAPATGDSGDLPVLAAADVPQISAGLRVGEAEVRDGLAALRSLSPPIRREVAAVLAPTSERITLSLRDGTQIRFGAAESLDAKNKVLQALLAQLRESGGSGGYIDIRVPTSPAVSDAPAATGTSPPRSAPAATP